jgi:predicted dienelactone hydrolase
LEGSRKNDVVYILRELSENKTLSNLLGNVDKTTVFLVGYGAGGAALTTLAGQADFSTAFPQVRGIVSVEAPLLSSLEGDPLPEPAPVPSGLLNALYQQATDYVETLKPRSITHITEIPKPELPVLFLLSDRAINGRGGRYETIIRTFKASETAVLIAAVRGAGPFDYSASPKYYPLYSFLFRGAEQTKQNRDWPELTASLITNFAVLVLENETAAVVPDISPEISAAISDEESDPVKFTIALKKTALDNSIFLEQGGVWQIPSVRTILQP